MTIAEYIQNNAEFLLNELNARAAHQVLANGHIDDRLDLILDLLEDYLDDKSDDEASTSDSVAEAPETVAAFVDDVSHEQFTHPDDIQPNEEIK